MTRLCSATLPMIAGVASPTFDRAEIKVGIVHFGFGNFHRSHEAQYVDSLMENGMDLDWGICGVGVLPQDAAMRDAMRDQDGLYTLILRHPDGSLEPRIVGSVREYLFAPDKPEAVFEKLSEPNVRIVSLTVTEGGYLKHPATGAFDAEHPSVQHDLAHPKRPQTAFAYIVEGLSRRKANGTPPFTVLSCDNLQGNGDIARQTIVQYAALRDPKLSAWIDEQVSFPNSMVDRITPATTQQDRDAVAHTFGYDDAWPVPTEPFTQWIVEDRFSLGRPRLEDVGVHFVDDVKPYELMKLRLLNASHQAIAYLGAPLGYVLVDEALADDRIRTFLLAFMRREAVPTLGDLPGVDLDAYMSTLIERFSNRFMRDTLVRLATDGGNRMATFTLPAIRENLAAGRDISLGATIVAAWIQFWKLIAQGALDASAIPEDVFADRFLESVSSADAFPADFLRISEVFGDLAADDTFQRAVRSAYEIMLDQGVHAAVERVV